MLTLLTLALTRPAQAGLPAVVDFGPAIDLGVSGTWGEVLTDADGTGWWLAWADQGELWAAPLQDDGGGQAVDLDATRGLTGRRDLVDHALARCPDGTWLHVASLSLDSPDDSAWAFVYDADLRLLASGPVEERQAARAHNDMAVVCDDAFRGVSFPEFAARTAWFFPLDEDARPADAVELVDPPVLTGGSLVVDPETGLLTAMGTEDNVRLAVSAWDEDFVSQRYTPVEVDEGRIAWWPQGLVRVGEGWLVVHLSLSADEGPRDADLGDIWIGSLYHHLYYRQGDEVAGFTPPAGAGRPAIAYRDGLALVTYDHDQQIFLHELEVDPDAVSTGGGDGALPGSDADSGGADTAAPAVAEDVRGGCATAAPGLAGGLAGVLLALLGLPRRRL